MNYMDQYRPATDPAALSGYEIELRMLAVRDHVPGLRALVAERAMRSDHDLDFIDDARLVVDEVCGLMMANCHPTEVLTMRLLVDAHRIRIDASVPTFLGRPTVGALSLRVLEALADSLDYWVDDREPESIFRLSFSRSRRRR